MKSVATYDIRIWIYLALPQASFLRFLLCATGGQLARIIWPSLVRMKCPDWGNRKFNLVEFAHVIMVNLWKVLGTLILWV